MTAAHPGYQTMSGGVASELFSYDFCRSARDIFFAVLGAFGFASGFLANECAHVYRTFRSVYYAAYSLLTYPAAPHRIVPSQSTLPYVLTLLTNAPNEFKSPWRLVLINDAQDGYERSLYRQTTISQPARSGGGHQARTAAMDEAKREG